MLELTAQAEDAIAAWKAAQATVRELRAAEPQMQGIGEDIGTFLDRRDGMRGKTFEACRASSIAFKAMGAALPRVGKVDFITPRQFMALTWESHYVPGAVWSTAEHWKGWYPALVRIETNLATGEQLVTQATMFDDCVDEAAALNAELEVMYAAKASGDWSAYNALPRVAESRRRAFA